MDQLEKDAATSSVSRVPETQSKKRQRPDDETPSPTDGPTLVSADLGPSKLRTPRANSRDPDDSGRPPLSDHLSLPGNGNTSTSSLPESAFSGSFSPSASVPSLSTGQRGSLSPPYAPSGSSRPPESLAWATDTEESRTEEDELEEQAAVEQAEEGSIVVDSDDLASDAGYGTDNNTTASTSLADSVRDYIYENGRRYHKFREGRYNFPNDDVE